LWSENLLPLPEASTLRPSTRSEKVPFDNQPKTTIGLEDSTSKPVALVGPVMNRTGVCFQRVRTLTCLDPISGKPAWTRQDLDQSSDLFGDEQFMFSVLRGESEAVMLDAVDGRVLGRRTLPPARQCWAYHGRNILAWESLEDGHRLFLFDPEQQRDIWSVSMPPGSRGCLVENGMVATVLPDGRFTLRSLTDDTCHIDFELPAGLPIETVRVRPSQNQWLVIVNDNHELPPEVQPITVVGTNAVNPVNGRIFAFDRRDGTPLWESPATVRGYAMLIEQPDDLPTLWFVRQFRQAQTGQAPQNRTDVLCLDRRTGTVLLDRQNAANMANQIQVTVDAGKHEISLVLPNVTYTIRFTDAPRPPESPAQVGT
jgi:outer membrane protein assembly factor BamB